MPIYRFKCKKCENEFEDLVMKRGETSPCPECGSKKVERMVSAPAKHVVKGADGTLCDTQSCDIQSSCGCMGGHCPHG